MCTIPSRSTYHGAKGMVMMEQAFWLILFCLLYTSHPKFEQVQKQLKDITASKQKEAQTAIDKESDDKKKAQIYQSKRQELAKEEQKLMEPLFKEINLAIRTVANQKKLTVVVDKEAVFYGGIDITDAVVAELKKK